MSFDSFITPFGMIVILFFVLSFVKDKHDELEMWLLWVYVTCGFYAFTTSRGEKFAHAVIHKKYNILKQWAKKTWAKLIKL